MTSLLINNCRLYDAADAEPLCSALMEDGRIVRIGTLGEPAWAEEVLDAQGCILSPGLIRRARAGCRRADCNSMPRLRPADDLEDLREVGVTGFLATTVYMPGQANAI